MSNELRDKVRPFLTRPAVIDWLQWNDFSEKLGEPDYPQLTLQLIEEYRLHVKKQEEIIKVLKEALDELVVLVVLVDDFNSGGERLDSFTTQPARQALAKVAEMEKE